MAHPGHYEGGEVTGELLGDFIIDWTTEDGRELGEAMLLAGDYHSTNFTFQHGSEADLDTDDPLLGFTARFSGSAERDGETVDFTILLSSPEGRELVGAPFEATIGEGSQGALHLRLELVDPFENDTLFDGVDFRSLDSDADGILNIAPGVTALEDAYNLLLRTFQNHDHYTLQHME